jgi:hypothetical protein
MRLIIRVEYAIVSTLRNILRQLLISKTFVEAHRCRKPIVSMDMRCWTIIFFSHNMDIGDVAPVNVLAESKSAERKANASAGRFL